MNANINAVSPSNSQKERREEQISDRYLAGMLGRFLRPFWKELALIFLMLVGVTTLSLLPPYLIQRAVDGPIQNKDLSGLIPYGVVYLLSVIGLFILRFAHTFLLQNVGQNALVNLRQALFEHILQQDMRFF